MSVSERSARNISVTSQLFLKSCIILMHSEDLNKFVLQKVEKQLLKNLCRQDDHNDREEGKKTVINQITAGRRNVFYLFLVESIIEMHYYGEEEIEYFGTMCRW